MKAGVQWWASQVSGGLLCVELSVAFIRFSEGDNQNIVKNPCLGLSSALKEKALLLLLFFFITLLNYN